ncbi:bifunctional tRNA (adenosine(37)-C2)-methyltransferase TrmG/ribosomal RNA large subunit methyltransferase RlmN [Thiocystis violascens]|uniref:Dual-specificity RNA methyltransferase RlmN n=1 Tax=Thiocystis violascens (strain ATCC 17096 / DSM 198 / 6111) TaxID=765911 RepID=I3YCD0_THIV6|nr:bifunctional tRNA (adenosine(37)-C2)-methyltransferase TrmG/ribosomal RNA large subunit methyltransferase RlmN [Thiocystis violascens]AFL74648.1 23S rRNA m(2)A-2503 methyltransferase [Thiocystis violascens DSM 198]
MTTAGTKPNLLNLNLADCEALVVGLGVKAFHGRNLFKWVHKHGVVEFDAMTDLSRSLRETLRETVEIRLPRIVEAHPSEDGTIKWIMELHDGQRIETVFIPEGRRSTICVSSQVGCALECAFCATARQGFNRNLAVSEIIGQVWHAARQLDKPPTNVVMMGMGEPLANFESVVKAMDIMQDDLAYMLAKQRVTLSTSGIVPNIYRLREVSDVSLAVSLHAPNDALRDQLVPINRKYPLAELLPACKAYIGQDKRRKVTWEYVMLDGINDSLAHAKQLIRLLEGIPSKLNLIPFNPFAGSDFGTSPPERIEAFRLRLTRAGIFAMTRKTRGDEIAAACGQLVGRVEDRTRRLGRVVVEAGPRVATG